jgi:hypothetical protein
MKKIINYTILLLVLTSFVFAEELVIAPTGSDIIPVGVGYSEHKVAQAFSSSESISITGFKYEDGGSGATSYNFSIRTAYDSENSLVSKTVLLENINTTQINYINFDTPLLIDADTVYYFVVEDNNHEPGPPYHYGYLIMQTGDIYPLPMYHYEDGWGGDTGADLVLTLFYASPCTPSWSCSEYSECLITPTNHLECLAVVDANNCGESFSGSLSTYNVNSCTVPRHGSNAITAISNQKTTTVAPNPVETFILNFRSWIFNLLGVKA